MHRYPKFPSPAFSRQLNRRLATWFRQAQRALPWRRDRDPYHIWVSEIMLQQTQVATVIPYYERFIAAFPTIKSLAAASTHDVLRLWEGLGYYRRARDLHRAAREIVRQHAGVFPREPARLAQLPGIGRYTLGAILSQAFDQRQPIVEANSARVLSRWFACADDSRTAPAQRWLWKTAQQLLPVRGSGEFNQALMELGALVCTAARPSCLLCPVSRFCAAHADGLEDRIPPRAKAPPVTTVREVALAVRKAGKLLLVQRPAGASRWAELWEFPHGPALAGEPDRDAAIRIGRELVGIETDAPAEAVTIRHGITRFQITMVCFIARYAAGRVRSPFYARSAWTSPAKLAAYPLSSPQRRLAKALTRQLPDK